MSMHHKTNLPVPVNRVKTLEPLNRRNLAYLVTVMMMLLTVATLIIVVDL